MLYIWAINAHTFHRGLMVIGTGVIIASFATDSPSFTVLVEASRASPSSKPLWDWASKTDIVKNGIVKQNRFLGNDAQLIS